MSGRTACELIPQEFNPGAGQTSGHGRHCLVICNKISFNLCCGALEGVFSVRIVVAAFPSSQSFDTSSRVQSAIMELGIPRMPASK